MGGMALQAFDKEDEEKKAQNFNSLKANLGLTTMRLKPAYALVVYVQVQYKHMWEYDYII